MISIKNCKNGMMAFNTNDLFVGRSFMEYGEFSEGEVDLFRAILKPGMTACDVGANIGTHTIPMARLVGSGGNVLAFEPQRMCYYTLCANVVLNNLINVICLQNAVGSENSRIHVPEYDFSKTNNFGSLNLRHKYDPVPHGHSVKLVRIDDFDLPACHLLKADVEGMEIEVVLGAKETIERHHPFLYLESDQKQKTTPLMRILNNIGYTTYVHAPPLYNSRNFMGNASNVFSNISSINVFSHHKEAELSFDPAAYNMTEIGKERTFIIMGSTPEDAKRIIDETQHAVIQGLCGIADSYSDNFHDPDTAMMYINRAISLVPDDWMLYNKALPILAIHMRYEDALYYADKAIEKGGSIEVVGNRAILLGALGRHKEAIEDFRQVLESNPNDAESHFSLGVELLKTGQFEEGWKEYEWRFKKNNPVLLEFLGFLPNKPSWDGEPLNGRRILLYTEQGAGDLIQFVRYTKLVKELGGQVIVACFPALESVCKLLPGVDEVVVHGPTVTLPEGFNCDVMCSLLSLPRIFGTTSDAIPSIDPWTLRRNHRFDDVTEDTNFKVGVCWAGSETHPFDFSRSTFLKYFEVFQRPGVNLYSLQKGRSDRTWARKGKVNLREGSESVDLIDLTERIEDFYDTADLIKHLDLVITVDTSVAHLAGSMGKPVWTLLWKNTDWRWMERGREDTPWYPSMTLIWGDSWEDIFARTCRRLDALLQ